MIKSRSNSRKTSTHQNSKEGSSITNQLNIDFPSCLTVNIIVLILEYRNFIAEKSLVTFVVDSLFIIQ